MIWYGLSHGYVRVTFSGNVENVVKMASMGWYPRGDKRVVNCANYTMAFCGSFWWENVCQMWRNRHVWKVAEICAFWKVVFLGNGFLGKVGLFWRLGSPFRLPNLLAANCSKCNQCVTTRPTVPLCANWLWHNLPAWQNCVSPWPECGRNLPIFTRGLGAHILCRDSVAGLATRAMLNFAPTGWTR